MDCNFIGLDNLNYITWKYSTLLVILWMLQYLIQIGTKWSSLILQSFEFNKLILVILVKSDFYNHTTDRLNHSTTRAMVNNIHAKRWSTTFMCQQAEGSPSAWISTVSREGAIWSTEGAIDDSIGCDWSMVLPSFLATLFGLISVYDVMDSVVAMGSSLGLGSSLGSHSGSDTGENWNGVNISGPDMAIGTITFSVGTLSKMTTSFAHAIDWTESTFGASRVRGCVHVSFSGMGRSVFGSVEGDGGSVHASVSWTRKSAFGSREGGGGQILFSAMGKSTFGSMHRRARCVRVLFSWTRKTTFDSGGGGCVCVWFSGTRALPVACMIIALAWQILRQRHLR